jgi:hypothetical protein
MNLRVNTFYIFSTLLVVAGWTWVWYASVYPSGGTVCIFKNLTGLPCPSCGSTTAAIEILHGNVAHGLAFNPIGLLLSLGLIISPAWLFTDLVLNKKTLYSRYYSFEKLVAKNRWILPCILLSVALLWIWKLIQAL